MKLAVMAFGALFAASVAASAEGAGPAAPQLRCEIGPVIRHFGGTDWLVYSCDDGRSMVVVSTEKNPAAPFYFLLTPASAGYRIDGEGNGNKQASDAAGDDLARMSAADFINLLAETRRAADQKH